MMLMPSSFKMASVALLKLHVINYHGCHFHFINVGSRTNGYKLSSLHATAMTHGATCHT